VEGTSGARVPKAKIDCAFLARCLNFGSAAAPQFETALEKAFMLGALPFEVTAGTPRARYGARMSFFPPAERSEFLATFGLTQHPWGPPVSVSLRTNDKGELVTKAYHRLVPPLNFSFHEKLAGQMNHFLAALYNDATEAYFTYSGSYPWTEFVNLCLTGLGTVPPQINFQPPPRSTPRSFGAAVLSREGEVKAISVYADYRSLPDDETISRLWTLDMSDAEREAYELTLAAVRSCGARMFGSWHSYLVWTFERGGVWHKATSLHFPAHP
jgi:hypothetical protein